MNDAQVAFVGDLFGKAAKERLVSSVDMALPPFYTDTDRGCCL
jgi:hypothetical protein